MLNNIISILKEFDISGYKIIEKKVISEEMFSIKKQLDMNRNKEVHKFNIVVYVDFEENGEKFKGDSSIEVYTTMSDEEIRKAINDASYAAKFVKNKYYPLVSGIKEETITIPSKFNEEDSIKWMIKLKDSLYKNDNKEDGSINSSEIFLNKVFTRIVNSEGVDVSYISNSSEIEFITNWKGEEEVELYNLLSFSDYNEAYIENKVEEALKVSEYKAKAKEEPSTGSYNVILKGENVKEMMTYYYTQANAKSVYNKIGKFKIGDKIQGENVKGDLLNITLIKELENSPVSSPYDEDGFKLSNVKIIEDGKLINYYGDVRNSYYLNVSPTGTLKNYIVEGGSKSIEEMNSEPCIIVEAFSDFQMNSLTGDFGGEIRLALYVEGDTITPMTGGSISGNIKNVQGEMYLSSEVEANGNFFGPRAMLLKNISVAGR
ncbi:modulator of DNA gyrase family protein [Clostridium argentinense CDC 2741]|uniref:Modulator of DNA gyrase family protein n=1 Tax=Clostridium argentinense CDC 2741 TaxID=1418104 RepID=A0A0C1U344_9CLOT|nr:metallopeptidase TldD-related protein [Clostridium argentinense]ARC83570.1 peptidase U62 [Clostridium argentinense]KIE45903.1 modulator of DNA gyrase family protein [Clostridium argentinense CDC 2741]NFF40547.1 TldD/PmbA family protein [Clostridium argentinense]NFP50865.1 TldD/PmbA family protein [Clostridium argentinense]NFP74086.1 TldD/PmbA family protein [Clostridium argentinense]